MISADQTVQMCILILVFAGFTCLFVDFVLRWLNYVFYGEIYPHFLVKKAFYLHLQDQGPVVQS